MGRSPTLVGAALVAFISFLLYRSTLLPGMDLGDTASFQSIASSPILTPRQGYPLYYALGHVLLTLTRAQSAFAMNLASAVSGALACGTLCLIVTRLTGRVSAGIFSGLLFAGSYTFWSQAVIAEVYALHLLLMALGIIAILRWRERQSTRRLALFFLVYAVSFGNHLSMILLLPAFAAFLLLEAGRNVIRARIVVIALVTALLGSLQYLWNLASIWGLPELNLWDIADTFWADVTKTDWRTSLVLGVPRERLYNRFLMYWFDIRQQFGLIGIGLVLFGCWRLARRDSHSMLMLLMMYVAVTVFAFTYNVGDTHVFFMPAHLVAAVFAGCAFLRTSSPQPLATSNQRPETSDQSRLWRLPAVAVLLALSHVYAGWRILDNFPALDRSTDRRAQSYLDSLTMGLDGRTDVFVADHNWQMLNGLDYYTDRVRPQVVYTRLEEVMPRFVAFLASNLAADRRIVLTGRGVRRLRSVFGDALPVQPDSRLPPPRRLSEVVLGLPANTAYVFCWLEPLREYRIDADDLSLAAERLFGGSLPRSHYAVVVGRVGQPPVFAREASRPFRAQATIGSVPLDIRIECWLPADTIRRAGFGSVIARRTKILVMERGISFVSLDEQGRPVTTSYVGGIFEPEARYIIARTSDLAGG